MKWSWKKKIIVSSVIGWTLTIIGAVMIPLLQWVVRKIVEKTVIIKEGGEVYDYWLNPPVPIYMQFYMFNVTNPGEVLQKGERPSLAQYGPYTYSEKRVKFNITWNKNGTVTYRQKRIFHFLPDMSRGKESDMFLTPNPVYWTLFNGMKYEDPILRKLLADAAALFDEHVFMTRSMKEIIWGYRDILLNITKTVDPDWFYTDTIGYFMNKNETDDGVYTVYTGETDLMKLGVIDKYNGTSYLKFWTTNYTNMINGSDGTLGPPYIPRSMTLYSFVSDVCRSVSGNVVGDVKTKQGIPLWRYQASKSYMANATENPDNIGYCTPQTNCLGAGIYNATICQQVDFFNVPVAFSFPHFYEADQRYIDSVQGLHPVKEEHETYIDLEPYTGLVLQAAKRLQGNIYIHPVADVSETRNITPVFLPVFWLNESVSIDDPNADKLKSLLFTPLKIIHIGEIIVISIGVTIILATLIAGIVHTIRNNRKAIPQSSSNDQYYRDGDREETQPIIRNDVTNYTQEDGDLLT